MRWRWLWRRAADTSDEARAELRRLERRDHEVNRLGAELREQQRLNNFTRMVAIAISRHPREGA